MKAKLFQHIFGIIGIFVFSNSAIAQTIEQAKAAYENKDFEYASTLFEKLLQNDARNYTLLKGFADSKHKLEDFELAIKYYNLGEEINDQDAELYFNRGAAKVFVDDYRGVIKDMDRSLELSPNNPKAFYYKGYANGQLGRFKKAIEEYNQAIKLKPDYSEAYYNRGAAKSELDNFNSGKQDFEMALEKNPKLKNGMLNIALSKLGMNKYEEAIADLTKIVDQRSDNLDRALFYRAEANYELGNKEQSCADWLRSSNLGYEQATNNYNDFCSKEIKKKKGINIIF
ncbi:MAG: hypothetical protein CMO34_06415 [Verrucomicrobia bacterium]|mgnify:CR=1 FL=1|nr:hypothetical protein [Verrucomicrobiota bacterium]